MRKLKYFFTVPEGEKVTEKHFRRILISYVCSILLCMSCLFSTTWALFQHSVVSENNVIQMGTFKPEVVITSITSDTRTTWTIDFINKGSITIPEGTYIVKVDSADNSKGTVTVSVPGRITFQNGTEQPIHFDAGVYQITVTNVGNSRGYFCGSAVVSNMTLSLPGPTLYPAGWQNAQAILDEQDNAAESITGRAYQIDIPQEETLNVYSCWGESPESQSSLISMLQLYAYFLDGSIKEVDSSVLNTGSGATTEEETEPAQGQGNTEVVDPTVAAGSDDPTVDVSVPPTENPNAPTELDEVGSSIDPSEE